MRVVRHVPAGWASDPFSAKDALQPICRATTRVCHGDDERSVVGDNVGHGHLEPPKWTMANSSSASSRQRPQRPSERRSFNQRQRVTHVGHERAYPGPLGGLRTKQRARRFLPTPAGESAASFARLAASALRSSQRSSDATFDGGERNAFHLACSDVVRPTQELLFPELAGVRIDFWREAVEQLDRECCALVFRKLQCLRSDLRCHAKRVLGFSSLCKSADAHVRRARVLRNAPVLHSAHATTTKSSLNGRTSGTCAANASRMNDRCPTPV